MMYKRQRQEYVSEVIPTKRVGVVERWKGDKKGRKGTCNMGLICTDRRG